MMGTTPSRQERSPRHQARVKRLPRRDDTWQVDVRPVDLTPSAGNPIRRWITAAVSEADEEVVLITLTPTRPPVRRVWDMLAEAMLHPEDSCPSRPGQVQVRGDRRLRGLGSILRAVDIQLSLADDLDLIEDLFEQLNEDNGEAYERCLLDMPGVTPRMVKSVFQAAAAFYRRAPWKKAANAVRIEWPEGDGAWYAAVTGSRVTTPGLVLSESLETVQRIREGNLSDKKARSASALAIVFGRKKQLIETDREMVQQYELPVAGPRAFPVFFRQEPGPVMRPPFARELQLLDGCLRTIPRFLTAGNRTSARPFEARVPAGAIQLRLWRMAD
jgi:hypothetical protein